MFTGPALNTKRMTGIPGPDDKETLYCSIHLVISVRKGNVYLSAGLYSKHVPIVPVLVKS